MQTFALRQLINGFANFSHAIAPRGQACVRLCTRYKTKAS